MWKAGFLSCRLRGEGYRQQLLESQGGFDLSGASVQGPADPLLDRLGLPGLRMAIGKTTAGLSVGKAPTVEALGGLPYRQRHLGGEALLGKARQVPSLDPISAAQPGPGQRAAGLNEKQAAVEGAGHGAILESPPRPLSVGGINHCVCADAGEDTGVGRAL